MNSELFLHYNCLSQFQKQYKGKLLDSNHVLKDGMIHIPKMQYPDGAEEENFWGWTLSKDGYTYLLSNSDKYGNKRELKDVLPLIPTKVQEVASRGKVYKKIVGFQTVKFKSEKRMSFKELVDKLSAIPHSNPTHRKLLTIIGLASYMDRIYTRVCSPPGNGKDSVVDILGNLVGECSTIENPTVAKLYYESQWRQWLAINEVVDIKPDQWMDIEQFLLAAGAFKPLINKRSRSTGDTTEEIDISDFSISIMYNDYHDYPKKKREERYFDKVSKSAVMDRFPSLRVHGKFTADFIQVDDINIEQFVTDHMDDYKDLIYTILYFKDNFRDLPFKFTIQGLKSMSPRWYTNIKRLLRFVSFYCSTQSEFDEWVSIINDCILDYQAMMVYDLFYDRVLEKIGMVKMKKLTENYLNGQEKYSTRIKVLDEVLKGDDKVESKYW
mgnify:CR=1 FL=1